MRYLANAFSLGMLGLQRQILEVERIDLEQLKQELELGFESIIGHESTANFLTKLLGREVAPNRRAIQLKPGDVVFVVQLLERLPVGRELNEQEVRMLYDNGKVVFYKVIVEV